MNKGGKEDNEQEFAVVVNQYLKDTPQIKQCINCKTTDKLNYFSLQDNGFKCINCDDGISYPNKFSYFLFQNVLSQLSYYENEYSPKWIGKKLDTLNRIDREFEKRNSYQGFKYFK